MGRVIKQSIANMLTTYLGFGIGAINTLFIYTRFLSKDYNGLISFLLSTSNLIWPLMAFGMHNTLVKFYSSYSNKNEQDKFVSMLFLFPILVSIILGTIGYLGYEFILSYFDSGKVSDQKLISSYGGLIYVIAFSMTYFEIFFSWTKVQLKSVFGNFMKEVFQRIGASILLVFVYLKWIDIPSFIYGLVGLYCIRVIILGIYALNLQSFQFKFEFPTNYLTVFKYSSLILIAGSVAVILIDLDKIMIKKYLPIGEVMVYSLGVYIASVIAVPSRAMHQITYPLTAKLLNEKNKIDLYKLYKSSSLNLLIISGFVFILILCNVKELYHLIPDEYSLYIGVILLIAIAKLYDNALGNTNAILYNSDYYRTVLIMGVFLALLAYILNLIFIPIYGINGAAIATFIAIFFYNTLKILFVKLKFKIQPFTSKTLIVTLVIFLFILLFYFWDFDLEYSILNIALKSILIGFLYGVVIYYSKLSSEINAIVKKLPILKKIL